jgi:transcription elongation GreA/GreB family factor
MRNLKIERMRNAGANAARDVVLERYRQLQARIQELKRRLRQYEMVEDLREDTAPIVLDD